MPLQSIDNIHTDDSLPLGMLSVGDSITDDVLKENLEDTSGLFIDETTITLDTTMASQLANGDILDVIMQDFAVMFGTFLAKFLASFACSGYVEFFLSV